MAQTKFVGELGAQSLAALGAGQRIFFAMQAILMAISAGTTALVARAWGAGDYDEASRVTMASLVLAAAFSFAIAFFGFFLARPVASVFGLDPQTLALAAENIRWLSVFNLAFAAMFVLSAALRASGDAWSPLWISGGVNLLNLLCCSFSFSASGAFLPWVLRGCHRSRYFFQRRIRVLLILWVRQKSGAACVRRLVATRACVHC